MNDYTLSYRIGAKGHWYACGTTKARSAAGAIVQMAKALQDIEGDLEICALLKPKQRYVPGA